MSRALIVVDVQNDFCEGGALGVEGGHEVARKIRDDLLLNTHYNVVAFTQDWHIDPGSHWSNSPDFTDTWPVHCEAGTEGAEFAPALLSPGTMEDLDQRYESTGVRVGFFRKGQYDAAYSGFEAASDNEGVSGESMDEFLGRNKVTQVEVVGIAFDHCVRATALDAVNNGYVTSVLLPYTVPVSKERAWDVSVELTRAGVVLW